MKKKIRTKNLYIIELALIVRAGFFTRTCRNYDFKYTVAKRHISINGTIYFIDVFNGNKFYLDDSYKNRVGEYAIRAAIPLLTFDKYVSKNELLNEFAKVNCDKTFKRS